jgi:hypothetical protein
MLPLLSNEISEAGQVWAASIRESILLPNVAIVWEARYSTPATRLMSARRRFTNCRSIRPQFSKSRSITVVTQ